MGGPIDRICGMKDQITIPLSDYKQLLSDNKMLLSKVSSLETKLEQLTVQYQELLSKHEILLGEHKDLNIKYIKLVSENERLSCENATLKETVLHLRNQIFGKKKDKIENGSNIRDLNKVREEKIAKKKGRKPISPEYQADEVRVYDYACNPECVGCQIKMHRVGSNDSHHEDYQIVLYVCSKTG